MSARAAMKHAIEIGWRWDTLVLFDPPDVPPPGHPNYAAMEAFELRLTEFARNRRRKFASIDELANEYLQSRATRNWVPGMHELMARSVLRKSPDGDGFALTCAPENEAGIYQEAMSLNLWPWRRSSAARSSCSARIRRRKAHRPPPPQIRRSATKAGTTFPSWRAPGISCRSRSPTSAAAFQWSFLSNTGSDNCSNKPGHEMKMPTGFSPAK